MATDPATQQVIRWLLDGACEADVIDAIGKEFSGADPAALLQAAMKHFELVAGADPLVIRGWCLEAYRELYRKMIDIGDYANALRAVKELRQAAG